MKKIHFQHEICVFNFLSVTRYRKRYQRVTRVIC
nr:MAG TPA: hypothetical protein [Caudoviricetes sp.]